MDAIDPVALGREVKRVLDEKRAKYNADDIAAMVKSGAAMPNGSYPIKDEEDLRNAIHAVGRGSGSHDAIRAHIIRRAKALGLSDLIPDNWGADGSMKSADADGWCYRASSFQLATDARGDGLTLEGYAAVFNSPTLINDWLGEYEEVIAPGAFSQTINRGNPVLMFDHGKHPLVGSMPIGSIQALREDPHGLFVQARMFDNWMTEPLRQAITDQAVDGMSFRFTVPDGKETWDRTREPELRTIHEVKLYELGPVVFPAYKDTSVALRSLAAHVPGVTLVFDETAPTEEAVADPAPDSRDEAVVEDDPSERAVSTDEPETLSSDSLERRRAFFDRKTAGFHAHLARIKETE